jgi:hypothetical protein
MTLGQRRILPLCTVLVVIGLRIGLDLGAGDLEGGHVAHVGRIGRLALPARHEKPIKLAHTLKAGSASSATAIDECANESVAAVSRQFEGLGSQPPREVGAAICLVGADHALRTHESPWNLHSLLVK